MSFDQAQKPTVLIVEDHFTTLSLLLESLQVIGCDILIAGSGEEALTLASSSSPDLILLDVMLPGIDGFETCCRLKANAATTNVPVIFMTALAEYSDKIKGFEAGGVDYITKPFECAEAIARVKTHLLLRKFQQQLQRQNLLLEEEKHRFQMLSEATSEGLVLHQQGVIFDSNQAFEMMIGREHAEVIGRNLMEFTAPIFHDVARQHALSGEDVHYEIEMLRQNGKSFPVEVHAKSLLYREQPARIALLHDLSWRRGLEQEKARLEQENRRLKMISSDRYKFGDIIGKSPAMQAIYELVTKAAASDASIIIYGETGVGKELIARTIHQLSDRRAHEFVAVNCGAIPENLFEREFFGHKKGAFTGADRDSRGYFDHAHHGTLFLDEVDELPPHLQVKLLRAIEQREYLPVGSHSTHAVNVRILSATNTPPETQIAQGRMRSDFFFRLGVMTITVPPLRERKEDLLLLIEHFLAKLSNRSARPFLSDQILHRFYQYEWPGNIRELQNVLQRYLTFDRLEFSGKNSPPRKTNCNMYQPQEL
ncbi:PAS modulated sigma54 specific transcriptional regulator, Fis family [Candidatus Moduliflexus flocculans]|uniref:PAS modulated sigma54 specific transcriptional regulator, Fis family n=1 Tax=Candidatus Moduliflexus flocculans TaxID=1499966 RepID=A0A0S6W402_9BACT|nr:PAS modulated sigma54 specific transcriptional regulator, Fis family [Candidatus Moduliflexus flocculans]